MPPRHGKSELVSRRFPAFYLGRNPDARVIACSYNASLSAMFNRDVQRIMEGVEYYEIFPDTMIPNTQFSKVHPDNAKYKRTTSMIEIIDHAGHLLSPGVSGTITGLGADLLIIDDPVKNEEEANSETVREAIWGWWGSTAYTRLEEGANIVICQTRWHLEDLSGKLLTEMELGGEKWEVINLPAIATEVRDPLDTRQVGEALWPGKYDLDRLNIIQKQVGARTWSALYQQSPVIIGGNIIKEQWFQYYQTLPFDPTKWREAYLLASWDLGFKKTGKSFNAGIMLAKYQSSFYLLDIYHRKADIIELQVAIKSMAERWPACKITLVEDKANGSAILTLMKSKISNLVAIEPTASKDERLHSVAPIFEAGNFYLPANHPMTKVIVGELCAFPNGANDDIVDVISQALNRFMTMRGLRHLQAITKW
ncbi:MAG: phage terminase large subunit [Clostridiaceae bacterium]|nr:phage terminase large subunit [Clostridiaceae bacterium]